MHMKVFGANLSPFVRKVLVACKLKGLEFEHQVVMPGTKTPEYLTMSPLGKIPAFQDGDLQISDSSVICEYLEEKYPDNPLLPASPEDRARSRWYEEYADSKLAGCLAVFFFERMLKPMMGMGDTDEARLTAIIETEHPDVFDYLESQLPADGFLFGDEPGLADVAMASPFVNASYAGFNMDAERWPGTAAWLNRVLTLPVMVEVLAVEKAMMEKMAG
jgi:glutathione S-transferase